MKLSKRTALRTLFPLLYVLVSATPGWSQMNLTGWFADGQTWLVWNDNFAGGVNYEIYASTSDLVAAGTVAGAHKVGHLMPSDWQANRLRLGSPAITFAIPDGAGGMFRLLPRHAVFAYTPLTAGTLYFAVVQEGTLAVVPMNGTGPIPQGITPITAHLQEIRTTAGGQQMRVYAHWIMGDDDSSRVRPDYPLMGNSSANGTAQVFAVTDPLSGPPAGIVPTVVALHGGGSSWWEYTPDQTPWIGLQLAEALLVSLDDNINTIFQGALITGWLGYRTDLDRFSAAVPYPVPGGVIVGAYTIERVGWTLDWIIANEPIDDHRLSITGHSNGARGAHLLSRLWPERFSACTAFSSPLEPAPISPLYGDATQNLMTSIGYGAADLFTPDTRLSTERDIPICRHYIGRNDAQNTATWDVGQVQAYRDLDSTGLGYQLYWDGRSHDPFAFPGAYFGNSTRHNVGSLARFRNDESFPAFYGADLDTTTAVQDDDIGNGSPMNGDPFGTWTGYFDYSSDSIDDTPVSWACVMWLTAGSAVPSDNFPGIAARTNLTIRRPVNFLPPEGTSVDWILTRVSDGSVLQSGTTISGPEALVTVSGLILKAPTPANYPAPDSVRIMLTIPVSGTPGIEEKISPGTSAMRGVVAPNPFATQTAIRFSLPQAARVSIRIHDVGGRLVETLLDDHEFKPGKYAISWDGTASRAGSVPSGIYFVVLQTSDGGHDVQKVVKSQ